ncbi:2-deoxy-scyllo-inosamine dehydrogenase [Pelagimonas phthalicica]|uniref:2-deoxy-scyllo-inosamine dehydrogenase n=1 Tax=Pelagimonas phthalicica TaxID=1037362 RepID=A0A238JGN8_9RHOB|nr:alcohol dehydrogenase catalytic domain-containing protein [Pelagimonas phthalicica]TDS92246.1 (R,R)-butanediol dehydrogenase/meso-butanediol dehydrogenase/diacetyl reductase [Pelagimonas phthalicica]SMX29307.1 2-deoxy-scyllo-inosamine dehydrogenase [Pelagimonas phthalicica]
MKAIRIHGAGDVRLEEIELADPEPGEVLIRVRATGICGTDVEILDGTMAYFTRGMAQYPVVPGHEWVGEVASLGAAVSGFEVGDHVVGECCVSCGTCDLCKSGNYHRCLSRTETGILNRDGAFAEYMLFPAAFLHKISKQVDLRAAAMVEPTAIAFNGVKAGQVTPRDKLAIYGDGPIGLLLLLVAKEFGAKRIAVIGATPDRLALAAKLGADLVIDAFNQDVAAELSQHFGQPDVSIETTGVPDAASTAIVNTVPGGRVVLQGLFGGRKLNDFDLDQIVINDLSVKGALGSPGIWPDVISLIEQGRIDPLPIATHSIALQDFATGIDLVTSRKGIKVIAVQETANP